MTTARISLLAIALANLVMLTLGISLLSLNRPCTPVLTLGALSVFAAVITLYHLAERLLLLIEHDDLPANTITFNASLPLCLLAGPGHAVRRGPLREQPG